jgi:hypothetical protein
MMNYMQATQFYSGATIRRAIRLQNSDVLTLPIFPVSFCMDKVEGENLLINAK